MDENINYRCIIKYGTDPITAKGGYHYDTVICVQTVFDHVCRFVQTFKDFALTICGVFINIAKCIHFISVNAVFRMARNKYHRHVITVVERAAPVGYNRV